MAAVPDIDPVRRLLAIEDIKALKARYFRLVDDQQWGELRGLFTHDARFEFPGLGSFDDPDSCIDGIRSALTGTTTIHHGHMPEITVTSPETATGIWSLADVVIRAKESGGRVPGYPEAFQAGHVGFARYLETYRDDGDGWRIARLEVQRLRLDPLPEAMAG